MFDISAWRFGWWHETLFFRFFSLCLTLPFTQPNSISNICTWMALLCTCLYMPYLPNLTEDHLLAEYSKNSSRDHGILSECGTEVNQCYFWIFFLFMYIHTQHLYIKSFCVYRGLCLHFQSTQEKHIFIGNIIELIVYLILLLESL